LLYVLRHHLAQHSQLEVLGVEGGRRAVGSGCCTATRFSSWLAEASRSYLRYGMNGVRGAGVPELAHALLLATGAIVLLGGNRLHTGRAGAQY